MCMLVQARGSTITGSPAQLPCPECTGSWPQQLGQQVQAACDG